MKQKDQESERLKKWNEAVQVAKSIKLKVSDYQMKIAELALEVCEISHGGPVRLKEQRDKFTLKRFAQEANLHPTTLSNWIGMRKLVYEKLTSHQQKEALYTSLQYVSRFITRETPKNEVQRIYTDYFSFNSFERKILRYVLELKSLSYNFEYQAAAFKLEEDTLKEILFFTRKISEIIHRERPNLKPSKRGKATGFRASAANAVLGKRKKKKSEGTTSTQVSV